MTNIYIFENSYYLGASLNQVLKDKAIAKGLVYEDGVIVAIQNYAPLEIDTTPIEVSEFEMEETVRYLPRVVIGEIEVPKGKVIKVTNYEISFVDEIEIEGTIWKN